VSFRAALLAAISTPLGSAAEPAEPVRTPASTDSTLEARAPLARVHAVIESNHGVAVADPYRWMETEAEETASWLEAHDHVARGVLQALPERRAFREAVETADRSISRVRVIAVAGQTPKVFLWKEAPEDEEPRLIMRDGWKGEDQLLLDRPIEDEAFVRIFAEPSWDGRYVACVTPSRNGMESRIEILGATGGEPLDVGIGVHPAAAAQLPWPYEALASVLVSWCPDNRSFLYSGLVLPAEGSTSSSGSPTSAVLLHRLDSDSAASVPIFEGPGDALPFVLVTPGSEWALAGVAAGFSGDAQYFVAPRDSVVAGLGPRWRRVAGPEDGVRRLLARGDRLYALSHEDAPHRRILELPARGGTLEAAREIVPESDAIIETFVVARDALYAQLLDGARCRLVRVPWKGSQRKSIELPFEGTIFDLTASPERDGVAFGMTSWTRPERHYAYSAAQGLTDLRLVERTRRAGDDILAEEVAIESADGTLVPLSIVRRSDAGSDGAAPTLLEGFGAHGASIHPRFSPLALSWVDRGGILAFCHARGGGERGESWHTEGIKSAKERGVEDFLAAAQFLIERGYTASSKLVAYGTGAGCLLAGGALTRSPELFAGFILEEPIGNLLRVSAMEGGSAHASELGDPAVAIEFAAMFASDPYHRVSQGASIPPVLITCRLERGRVPCWQPAKLAARLLAATTGGPVLLRTEGFPNAREKGPRSLEHERWADFFAFAWWASQR